MRFLIAALVALALAASSTARADEPRLPAGAVTPDTFVIVRADLARLSPDSVSAALKRLPEPLTQSIAAPLAQYSHVYPELIAAGADVVFLAVSLDEARRGGWQFYVHLKADADAAATQRLISQLLGAASDTIAFEKRGDFLIGHGRNEKPFSGGGGAEADRAFAAALAAPAPAAVAFIPTAALRRQRLAGAEQTSSALNDMATAALDARWIGLGIDVGATPALTITVQAWTEPDARAFADRMRLGAQALARTADDPLLTAWGAAAAELKWRTNGDKAQAALDAQAIARIAARMGDAVAQWQSAGAAQVAVLQMKQLENLITNYELDHDGAMPGDLDDLKAYVGDEPLFATLINNPHTKEKIGYTVVKSAKKTSEVAHPATTANLYESKNGKPDPDGAIGYVDGHVAPARKSPTTRVP